MTLGSDREPDSAFTAGSSNKPGSELPEPFNASSLLKLPIAALPNEANPRNLASPDPALNLPTDPSQQLPGPQNPEAVGLLDLLRLGVKPKEIRFHFPWKSGPVVLKATETAPPEQQQKPKLSQQTKAPTPSRASLYEKPEWSVQIFRLIKRTRCTEGAPQDLNFDEMESGLTDLLMECDFQKRYAQRLERGMDHYNSLYPQDFKGMFKQLIGALPRNSSDFIGLGMIAMLEFLPFGYLHAHPSKIEILYRVGFSFLLNGWLLIAMFKEYKIIKRIGITLVVSGVNFIVVSLWLHHH